MEKSTQETFGFLTDENINIINNEDLNETNCFKFKNNLIKIKDYYNIELSKEYFLKEYKGNKNTFRQRFKKLLDKSKLKTNTKIFYKERLSSSKGNVFIEKTRVFYNFFVL
jgi:hypothetical protein